MKLFVKAFSWFLEWPLILASSRSGIHWHKYVICKSLYAISNNRENKIEGNKAQERQKAEILKINKMGIFKLIYREMVKEKWFGQKIEGRIGETKKVENEGGGKYFLKRSKCGSS